MVADGGEAGKLVGDMVGIGMVGIDALPAVIAFGPVESVKLYRGKAGIGCLRRQTSFLGVPWALCTRQFISQPFRPAVILVCVCSAGGSKIVLCSVIYLQTFFGHCNFDGSSLIKTHSRNYLCITRDTFDFTVQWALPQEILYEQRKSHPSYDPNQEENQSRTISLID